MGERWVLIKLFPETLRCVSCGYPLDNQKVHFYLNVDDELEEPMCDTCWAEGGEKE